jgi:diguanylate cyclase (GGDEF)-like protein
MQKTGIGAEIGCMVSLTLRRQAPQRRASVQTRLQRSFHVVLAAVGVLAVGLAAGTGLILTRTQPQLQDAVLAARQVRIAHASMVDQETAIRGYLLSRPDTAYLFLTPFFQGRTAADLAFDRAADRLSHSPSTLVQLEQVQRAAHEWQSRWADPALADPRIGRGDRTQAFIDSGAELFGRYRNAEVQLISSLTHRTDDSLTNQHHALLALLLLSLVVGVGSATLVWRQQRRLTRQIVTPVHELARAVRGVRDGGIPDLPERLDVDAPAEIHNLWQDFTQMTAALGHRARAEADERATLLSLSEADALTGLYNRRRLDADLVEAGDRSMSVVTVDIDHFKRLNDTEGHAAGDAALQRIAHLIDQATRDEDSAYRYGGEEFVLLLPGTDLPGATQLAERVRRSVAERSELTVSCGVATRLPGETSTATLQRADVALYAAKAAGRDRVEVG